MVFTEASASSHSLQALSICVPSAGAVHRSGNASSWLSTGKSRGTRQGVMGDGSVRCVAVTGQRDQQEGLGVPSELLL